jgi:hypothetical protein
MSSAICSSVHVSTATGADRPALAAEVDEHELGDAAERAETRPQVALVETGAAMEDHHDGPLDQALIHGAQLGTVDVHVEVGAVHLDSHRLLPSFTIRADTTGRGLPRDVAAG